jgi:capsule polysaccharide export protein KpsC/LpsZ
LRILSNSLPDDWIIYVKEHPYQFEGSMLHLVFRSNKFYEQLRDLRNVQIVKVEEDSEKLIKNAMFTSTITGSVGWQSLLNRKPCILFGVPWYAACNSCYVVKSQRECKKAVREIVNKTEDEVELDLLRYLVYYQNRFVMASIHHDYAQRSRRDYDTLVNNEAEVISARVNSLLRAENSGGKPSQLSDECLLELEGDYHE